MAEVNYNSAAALKAFLEERGLGMRKKFGQNFLINPGARAALVEALDARAGESVWEIGPGLGAMTRALLDKGLLVRAFEIDAGFARALADIFAADPGFALVEGDALKTWPTQAPAPYLFGNLPYNIAAALLADFVESGLVFRRAVVTVQREVAQRMAARPGSAGYSSFSVLCASAYVVKPLLVLKGASFYPRPNVDSQGVLLEARAGAEARPACFFPLVRRLFASRRKTIKNNLCAFLAERGKSAELCAALLEECTLDGSLRAENLRVEDFALLAESAQNVGIC